MIQGTRPYRPRNEEPSPPLKAEEPKMPSNEASPAEAPALMEIVPAESGAKNLPETRSNDATNLERRKWFSSLVPAFGDGLVKLLRASNNLERDIKDAAKYGGDAK